MVNFVSCSVSRLVKWYISKSVYGKDDINVIYLPFYQVEWLNAYHAECREKVGELLLQQGHKEAYNWLLKETEPMG